VAALRAASGSRPAFLPRLPVELRINRARNRPLIDTTERFFGNGKSLPMRIGMPKRGPCLAEGTLQSWRHQRRGTRAENLPVVGFEREAMPLRVHGGSSPQPRDPIGATTGLRSIAGWWFGYLVYRAAGRLVLIFGRPASLRRNRQACNASTKRPDKSQTGVSGVQSNPGVVAFYCLPALRDRFTNTHPGSSPAHFPRGYYASHA